MGAARLDKDELVHYATQLQQPQQQQVKLAVEEERVDDGGGALPRLQAVRQTVNWRQRRDRDQPLDRRVGAAAACVLCLPESKGRRCVDLGVLLTTRRAAQAAVAAARRRQLHRIEQDGRNR
jgi:hypothetical protein